MCHSVEMYLPEMSRRAAEARLAEATGRGRRAAEGGPGLGDTLLGDRLRGWLAAAVEGLTRKQARHG